VEAEERQSQGLVKIYFVMEVLRGPMAVLFFGDFAFESFFRVLDSSLLILVALLPAREARYCCLYIRTFP
jgi:hypothetical protein